MILLVGQIARDMREREAFQELDYRAVFGSMSKWATEIDDPARIPDIISQVNQVEVRNALDQANKELATRFDFKGSDARAELADKALTLVNFITPKQRLVDQIAVPQNTNEEAAVALHLPEMSLTGVCLTADAAHLTKANCRQITQESQADYLFTLKANQPHALAKAQQAFTGDFPPSGSLAG